MSDLVPTHTQGFSRDDIELIKATVAKGATDNELKLFLHRCRNMGLDPLKPGQVHFIKYGNNPGSIVVGIDGFRSKAMATGKHRGIQRGVIRDERGKVTAAWCEVKREGWDIPAREEVSMAEYSTGKSMWARMPETMLKKVAEAACLRMAFPDELGGIYSDDEMEQAAAPAREVRAEVTEPEPRKASPPAPSKEAPVANATREQIDEILSLASTSRITPGELAVYCEAIYGRKPGTPFTEKQALDLIELLAGGEQNSGTIMAAVARKQKDTEQPPEPTPTAPPPAAKVPPVNHAPKAKVSGPAAEPSFEGPPPADPAARAKAEDISALWTFGIEGGLMQGDMDFAVERETGFPDWDVLSNAQVAKLRGLFEQVMRGVEK